MRIYNTPLGRRSHDAETVLPDFAAEYRRHAGAWLRARREERGLTQVEMGKEIDMSGPGVSAIETGRAALAPERYEEYADALGIPHDIFGRTMLRWSNPWLYLMVVAPDDAKLRQEIAEIPRRYFTRDTPNSPLAKRHQGTR